MDNLEPSTVKKPSGIKPPSALPKLAEISTTMSSLGEISESQLNSKIAVPKPSGIAKAPTAGTMRGGSVPPRETLMERAGRTNRSSVPPPSVRTNVAGVSLASAGTRNTSTASSRSSRSTASSGSRYTSNSSYGSSTTNTRPMTAYGTYGHNRGLSQSTRGPPLKRSATALGDRDDPAGADGKRQAWDVDGRLEKMESMYEKMQSTIESTQLKDQGLEEAVNHYKIRLVELESKNASLETRGAHLDSRISILDSQLLSQQAELDSARQRISSITSQADDDVRAARRKLDDAMHDHQREVKLLKKEMDEELERMKRTYQQSSGSEMERMMQQHRQEIEELHRQSRQLLLEEERRRMQEVSEIQQRVQVQEQNLDAAVGTRDQQITQLSRELQTTQEALENEKNLRGSVQNALTASSASVISLEAKVLSLQDRIQFLESGSKAQSDRFALMEQQLHDALEATKESKAKLIHEETLRRILFNQVQELKGNIRVMCRVRPPMRDETCVTIRYPDLDTESKAVELLGPEEKSSLGTVSRKTNAFSFDRVFGPSNQNEDVFAEISQLVQSALDGYNVCIFAYGQTGAGKTHTMSSADGMIPRTAKMIYQQAKDLEDKGWRYTMEGSFVEVYNEEIHDLLGSPRDLDRVKHEIRHDDRKKQTTVTNLKTVELDSADSVNGILTRADANRSVAATKSNERSSRSHSVFILKLVGRNSTTGDVSEGTLNLVDLAGSERLKQSGAEGDRMKETQNINKSLSCLGDVIGALGQGKEGGHIPYRNSKLTYLLQYSLGGNSKTLMFVMVSPLEAHLKETLTSLKFATKVHNTHIGTARKSKRVE